jgi:hypothetical protein
VGNVVLAHAKDCLLGFGRHDVVEYLLQHGASVQVRDDGMNVSVVR